jgi:hypothetical protein
MPSIPFPSDDSLTRIAGATTFKRASAYARSGAVDITHRTDREIEAVVTGQDDYQVKVSRLDFEGRSSCTCTAFDRGAVCKHVVATAIVARDGAPEIEPDDAHEPDSEPESDLRAFLARQPAPQLATWLADLAESDSTIEKRLRVYQSRQNPAALRKALSQLLRPPSFLDWRRSRAYARELDPVVDTLASVAAADPAGGRELYEYALTRLFKIYGRSDDSGGDIGDRVRQIASDYLQVLSALPPGGAPSAKTLLKIQRMDEWGMLPVRSAWDVLTDAGRAAYAGAIEADYAELPAVTAENRFEFWAAGSGAVHRMEALAEARGDVGTLIKVYSRDLSSAGAYVRIVKLCTRAGREREAQQWAERGLKAHPDARGMCALVARQYAQAGLEEEARTLFWREFQRSRDAESWSELRESTGSEWPGFRERALEFLQGEERFTEDRRRDVSVRALLLLHDGDVSGARLLGESQALSVGALWTLARHMEASDPESAAGFLRRIVDFELPRAQARQYESVARTMAQVCRLSPGEETLKWVLEIRTRYRARRKFLECVEAALGSAARGA